MMSAVRLRPISALGFAAVLLAGCVPTIGPYDYSKEPDPRRSEYVIGVLDQLKIVVWKNPELSTETAVRPDGAITLPLLGDLIAAGHTPSQLKLEIERRLAAFVRDEGATATVAVTGVNSYRFTVSGNVEKPGVQFQKYYVSVLEAIALAGGPNRFAGHVVFVLRTDGAGRPRRIPIDYRRIASGAHPEENLMLLAGDTVVLD
jgi:polysaccharide export outer membrane protein